MKRLLAMVGCDIRLQYRNGFYLVTTIIVAIYLLLLSRASTLDMRWLFPIFALDNMVINSFYFITALVLLEEGEGTLHAQVVTPLRIWEYLGAKVVTLSLLAVLQNVITAIFVYGFNFGILPFATGIVFASSIYVLIGFWAVSRYTSINEFLFPSILYASLLLAPLLTYVLGWESRLVYLHPMHATLQVMRAGFQPVEAWQMVYGILYSGVWVFLAYMISRSAYRRFIVAGDGR